MLLTQAQTADLLSRLTNPPATAPQDGHAYDLACWYLAQPGPRDAGCLAAACSLVDRAAKYGIWRTGSDRF